MLYLILLFFMIVMVCGVISLVSNQSRKTKLEMEALQQQRLARTSPEERVEKRPEDREFEERWHALSRYDDQVRHAVEMLEPHGAAAVAELKRAFKVLQDKDKIGGIAELIMADCEAGRPLLPAPGSDEITVETSPDDGRTFFRWQGKRYFSRKAAESARDQAGAS